jgi:hypothetical protein
LKRSIKTFHAILNAPTVPKAAMESARDTEVGKGVPPLMGCPVPG